MTPRPDPDAAAHPAPPPTVTPPLSAFDCLSRGIANLRANWQLVPLLVVQQVVVGVLGLLTVAALFLPLVFFGGWAASLKNLVGLPPELIGEELFLLLMELVQQDPWTLILMAAIALVPSTLVGVAAVLAFGWLAGGIFGVLRDGEERAPVEEGVGWERFRAYSWRKFSDLGGRFMWPYFWFVNYFLVLILLVVFFVLLVMVVLTWVGEAVDPAVAMAVGCGALLPTMALYLGFAFWYLVGLVEVVRGPGEGEGRFAAVRSASRRAWRVLRRRWAALLVLAVVFMGGSLVVSIGMSPMGMYSAGVLDSSFVAWCGLQALSYLVQIAVLSVVHVAFYAALTALARDTAAPSGPPSEPEAA